MTEPVTAPATAIELTDLGWDDRRTAEAAAVAAELGEPVEPARVAIAHRGAWEVMDPAGTWWAEATGKMYWSVRDRRGLPAVGDWVLVTGAATARAGHGSAVVRAVLERRSHVVRRAAGEKTEPQVVAANIDVGIIVTSVNADLNPRRLERYLVTMRDGGVAPLIVLSKIDLLGDDAELTAALATIAEAAPGVPLVPFSAIDGRGIAAIAAHLGVGRTAALVGSSGVGKSTLTNLLLGRDAQSTKPIRDGDDRGRHATTRRELFVLPPGRELPGGAVLPGGVLIDTPGMRELQLWTEGDDDEATELDDIATLAAQCRFADCKHLQEPGCAVRAAVERGELDAGRLDSLRKLQGELDNEARRRDAAARTEEKRRAKVVQRSLRERLRDKGRGDK